jgi:hypothetical protein
LTLTLTHTLALTLGLEEPLQRLIFHFPLAVQNFSRKDLGGGVPIRRAHGRVLAMRLRSGRFEKSGAVQTKRGVLQERLQAV